MNRRTLFAVLCLAVLLFCPQGAGLHAEEPSATAESALVVLNSVFCIDSQYYLSCSKEGELFSVQADAATPCLYQGKLLPISGLKTGSKCLISYADGRASSILVLLMPETITYLYGMYYQYLDGALYLTVPGGEMQGYPLSPAALFFLNDNPISRDDFLRLSLPGDDIQLYLNNQKMIVKVNSYVIKDEIMGKTNGILFE